MSAGAVFKLIANDGKADRLIMATKLLNQRVKDVMCARKRAGKADITPTLVDIERTHVLFVNAHFKPFAAIGYEYTKVNTQSGSPNLGSSVTFSIPQFGDFFHDMVCRVRLGAATAVQQTVPLLSGLPTVTNTVQSYVDAFGNDVGVAVAGTSGGGSGLDGGGNAVTYKNLVRYCEYPANRLFTLVRFTVNGNPLDEYTDNVSMMLQKFCITPVKEVGYNRLNGQEVALEGYSGPRSCPVSDQDQNTPAGFVPANDVNRLVHKVTNGPQTPKETQPALELWHVLKFWFNEDARLSVPSVSIPFGQRFIEMTLAPQASMLHEFTNLYLRSELLDQANNILTVTHSPVNSNAGIPDVAVELMELYINHIFVNPEVHDIFIKRIGFSLIRVYRVHTQSVNQTGSDEKLLSQLKWPIEYMFVGLRPAWNRNAANRNQWRDWHRLTKVADVDCSHRTEAHVNLGNSGSGSSFNSPVVPDNFALELPVVNTLGLTAHGISIFDNFDQAFFSNYLPYHYGGNALRTPSDPGALFVNFALFPKSYQPSGHINVSRAREFFLKWNSSYVSASTPAELLAVAVTINFLLISDGSAVLRYST